MMSYFKKISPLALPQIIVFFFFGSNILSLNWYISLSFVEANLSFQVLSCLLMSNQAISKQLNLLDHTTEFGLQLDLFTTWIIEAFERMNSELNLFCFCDKKKIHISN